ncbi:MAG: signal peptide peptidase SppA [Chitinophagales bacterium]|nr:signal peptide peptidase SppA [Chitinophagales bacterium]
MWKFIKYVLATVVGLFLFMFIGLFILIGIAASAGKEKAVTVKPNSVLKLDLNYDIPEKTNSNPFSSFDYGSFKPRKATGLNDIVAALRKAATDNNIKGIYLDMGVNPNGYATLEVIRQELLAFKKSKKFIYAYGAMVSQKSYYLASVADKIILNPSGGMEITGFGREIMYYKNALDKLGIEVQQFHCGQFKSAIEPYTRDNMSEPNRQQLLALYGDVYQHFLTHVGESRKIDTAALNTAINDLKVFMPEDCKALNIVDELGYFDQLISAVKDKAGIDKKEELKFTDFTSYVASAEPEASSSSNKVAVIYMEGEIVDGQGKDGQIGGDEFAKIIRKARMDENVKALVLRVNSPGGSALASDIMWREVVMARKDKPVVVSFGDVAASGGYFISCNSDRIFAEPTSITGSIGIFGLIPNAKKLLNEKLGITTDNVEVTRHGAFNMVTNPFDEEERAIIQKTIEKGYREFKGRVAEGRGKDTAYIETIAQGHVYTGNQAIQNGLVDEIGGLDKAIQFAVKKANLKEYKLKEYPEEKDFATQISEAFGEAKMQMIKSELGDQYEFYKTLDVIRKGTGIQMRMPYDLGVE